MAAAALLPAGPGRPGLHRRLPLSECHCDRIAERPCPWSPSVSCTGSDGRSGGNSDWPWGRCSDELAAFHHLLIEKEEEEENGEWA